MRWNENNIFLPLTSAAPDLYDHAPSLQYAPSLQDAPTRLSPLPPLSHLSVAVVKESLMKRRKREDLPTPNSPHRITFCSGILTLAMAAAALAKLLLPTVHSHPSSFCLQSERSGFGLVGRTFLSLGLGHRQQRRKRLLTLDWDNLWERRRGSMVNGAPREVPESTQCTP